MALNSINTNYGSQVALQNLNATNKSLATTQNRINTGLKIATAKDNGAIWSIAQAQRAEQQSLNSVTSSLQRGQSTIDVALAAGDTISNTLVQMKELALQAADSSLSESARASLNEDFVALRDSITSAIENAEFDGSNLLGAKPTDAQTTAFATVQSTLATAKGTLATAKTTFETAQTARGTAEDTYNAAKAAWDGSAQDAAAQTTWTAAQTAWTTAQGTFNTAKTAWEGAGDTYKTAVTAYETGSKTYNTTAAGQGGFKALANADATSTLDVGQQNMSLGGAIITLSDQDDLIDIGSDKSGDRAKAQLTALDESIENVSFAMAKLGTASKAYDNHVTFIGKLQDSLETGVGNLVDADLAKESAKLTALQTKQQLGVQALSIANQSSGILLSLFR